MLAGQLLNKWKPRLTWVIPWVWGYDKSEGNLLIMLHFWEWLFVFISGTQSLRLPWSYIHLPATLPQSHVSAMRQRPTNKLRWEQLKCVVGTLLPSILSLPGNRGGHREGPPRRPPSEWTPNKNLPTGELHESVLVFLFFLFLFSPLLLFFIHGCHPALHFGRTIKRIHRKKKQSKCGNFSLFLFSPSMSFYQH